MSLLALQRDFSAWLCTGSDDAVRRLGAAHAPGLRVYQNNYRAQLVVCLETTFAHTRAWIGDDAFHDAMVTHIDRSPPRSWTLDAYGHDFPATLAALYPEDEEVAELARIEWALGEAFVGADHEVVTREAPADIDWDRASFRFSPTLRLIDLHTNAPAIWSALAENIVPPAGERLTTSAAVLVWRSSQVSRFRIIDRQEREALQFANVDGGFSRLCHMLVEALGEDEGITRAGTLLGRWIVDGLIAEIRVDRR